MKLIELEGFGKIMLNPIDISEEGQCCCYSEEHGSRGD